MSQPSLFDPPTIRTEAPSAPGSASSAEAASLVTEPMRTRSYRLVMTVLATIAHPGYLSRDELSDRTGILGQTLCARISELKPTWVEAVDGACRSRAGRAADGYRLTEAGWRRMMKANAPYEGFEDK